MEKSLLVPYISCKLLYFQKQFVFHLFFVYKKIRSFVYKNIKSKHFRPFLLLP